MAQVAIDHACLSVVFTTDTETGTGGCDAAAGGKCGGKLFTGMKILLFDKDKNGE